MGNTIKQPMLLENVLQTTQPAAFFWQRKCYEMLWSVLVSIHIRPPHLSRRHAMFRICQACSFRTRAPSAWTAFNIWMISQCVAGLSSISHILPAQSSRIRQTVDVMWCTSTSLKENHKNKQAPWHAIAGSHHLEWLPRPCKGIE